MIYHKIYLPILLGLYSGICLLKEQIVLKGMMNIGFYHITNLLARSTASIIAKRVNCGIHWIHQYVVGKLLLAPNRSSFHREFLNTRIAPILSLPPPLERIHELISPVNLAHQLIIFGGLRKTNHGSDLRPGVKCPCLVWYTSRD